MKTFKEFNEGIRYSGKDVTKMPIIGKVITEEIGPYESTTMDIVEIIDDESGKIYVANTWYKEGRVPQIIHENLIKEFIPTL